MTPEVSIVVVTYNSAQYIKRCLESIQRQSLVINLKAIVVDNASKDATRSIVEEFRSNSSFLQLISNEKNRYFAAAVNQGIAAAQSDYIFILNPDTELQPESLELLLEYFRNDRSVGVVAPQLVNPDGSVQPSCRRFPRHRDVIFNIFGINALMPKSRFFNGWKMGDFDHQQIREIDQPQGAALLTSRAVLDKVGGFDEDFPMFFNDVDWCYRVKQAGYKIVFYPPAKVIHLQGASVNRKKAQMIVFSHVSFFRFFEKYYDRVHHQVLNFIVGFLLYISIPFRVVWVMLRSLISQKT